MKTNQFNPTRLADETRDASSSTSFTSWTQVARLLADFGYNATEAEAILRSDWPAKAIAEFGKHGGRKQESSTVVFKYLDRHGLKSGSPKVNELVLASFPELVADDEGFPCHEGTCPGNPAAGKIKVRVGTPLSCDPTSETYWSM